jgi:hypothetical protein
MVFISRTCRHNLAVLRRAELCDGAIQHIDLIEKVDGYKERVKQEEKKKGEGVL